MKPAKQKSDLTRYSKMILKTSIDGFSVIGLDGKLLEVNSSLCNITGYSKEELLKMKISDIEAQWTPEQIAQRIDKVRKQGYDRFETKHRRKDGRIIDVEVSTQYCDSGEEQFFFAFTRDITDIKLSMEKLLKSLSVHKKLCNNIPGMVYRARPDWSTEFIANSEMVCGYTSEDMNSGKVNWLDIIHPDDREMILNDAPNVKAKLSKTMHVYRIIAKDGSIRWLEDHKSATFTQKGVFNGVDGVVFDITERKQLEAERENYREKLLKAQRHTYISSMGSIVAHQVNQPLTVINFLLGRAIEHIEEASCSPAILKDVKESLAAAKKAAAIIHKFRQYFHAPALENVGKVNISDVADRILSVLSEKAIQAVIRISIKGLGDLPEVETNEMALEQIFFIIIQNAIEAADGQKLHQLDITAKCADGNIELQFSDDCCGIANENIDKIFEPFFSTKTKDKGMGLGLDIVQHLLIDYGGQIRVESRHAKGTTFYLTLPINYALKP
jgi:PAS domain S-box-containing protein